MYISCYSSNTCEGRPWSQYFINETDFNSNPFTVYGPDTYNGVNGQTEGDCSSPMFYVAEYGNFSTNGCVPDTSYLQGTCYASCDQHLQTAGYIVVALATTKREAGSSKSRVAKKAFSEPSDIADYLEEHDQFKGAPSFP